MRRLTLILFLFLAFIPTLFAEKQMIDRVIAVVNNEPIVQSELDVVLRPIYEEYRSKFKGQQLIRKLDEVRQKLLNQLIEDRLVLQEAEKRGIEIEETAMDRKMEEFKKRFKSEQEMEQALASEGITLKRLRERFRKQMMIRALHDIEIRSRIVVSPLEIEEYYHNHPEEFSRPLRLRIRSITIRKSEEARTKGLTDEVAKERIEEARQRVLAGEDFGKVAREISEDNNASEGGLTDWIRPGEMIRPIDEVLFKLEEGQISEVIETPVGYHFFQIVARDPGRQKPLEEARDEIYAKLYYQKSQARFREWMEELKRKAYISIR